MCNINCVPKRMVWSVWSTLSYSLAKSSFKKPGGCLVMLTGVFLTKLEDQHIIHGVLARYEAYLLNRNYLWYYLLLLDRIFVAIFCVIVSMVRGHQFFNNLMSPSFSMSKITHSFQL